MTEATIVQIGVTASAEVTPGPETLAKMAAEQNEKDED